MLKKVVLDTNVFLSAIFYQGTPFEIIKLWKHGKFTLCLSPELLAEILEKLQVKFGAPQELYDLWKKLLQEKSEKFFPEKQFNLFQDKNDNFLLDLIHASQADYLVSGDKQILKLKRFEAVAILNPKEFLKML